MTEHALLSYFNDRINADSLNADVEGSEQKTSHDVYAVSVTQINQIDGFNISLKHLIKLCDDIIRGNVSFKNLNIIAYALVMSEYFYWDTDTIDGQITAQVLFDWNNPDIGHPITNANLILWKAYLEKGVYNLKIKKG
jgi:hypothetical protein